MSRRSHASRISRQAQRLGAAALELLWPTRCACCETHGALLCERCAAALPFIDQEGACPLCGAPAGALVCTECAPIHEEGGFTFTRATCALALDEPVRRLIVTYKDEGERRLAELLARLIASALPASWASWAEMLTWVPADEKAIRRRGFDHMRLIAEEMGKRAGLPARPLLQKRAQLDQRGLSRRQRRENAAALFSYVGAAVSSSPPAHVLLLDDVLTTGSTLDACAQVLLTGGVREVRVATIARVW
ncbi:MAG: double zinc ribbon domain-containing protein [Coriobacteriales bacterium]|jgi:ComF family protein|nr:double zinc ribbon domain-containing protein [Coriobacteriales bacterium]